MKDFRELKVWEKAHAVALSVYRITKDFPSNELYGLTSQIRRSAVSSATNIAEGAGRGTDRDFKHFLDIAFASANELDYLLLLSKDLGYLKTETLEKTMGEIVEVKKMLRSLIQKLIANC
jgi:four helix bundle protein